MPCVRAPARHTRAQRAADTRMRLHLSAQPRCPHEPASDSARRFDGGCAQRAALEMGIPASTNCAWGVHAFSTPGRSHGDAALVREIAALASLRLNEARRSEVGRVRRSLAACAPATPHSPQACGQSSGSNALASQLAASPSGSGSACGEDAAPLRAAAASTPRACEPVRGHGWCPGARLETEPPRPPPCRNRAQPARLDLPVHHSHAHPVRRTASLSSHNTLSRHHFSATACTQPRAGRLALDVGLRSGGSVTQDASVLTLRDFASARAIRRSRPTASHPPQARASTLHSLRVEGAARVCNTARVHAERAIEQSGQNQHWAWACEPEAAYSYTQWTPPGLSCAISTTRSPRLTARIHAGESSLLSFISFSSSLLAHAADSERRLANTCYATPHIPPRTAAYAYTPAKSQTRPTYAARYREESRIDARACRMSSPLTPDLAAGALRTDHLRCALRMSARLVRRASKAHGRRRARLCAGARVRGARAESWCAETPQVSSAERNSASSLARSTSVLRRRARLRFYARDYPSIYLLYRM
ncbi:hypothetical protein C8J57DRAFT_1625189 [Mycena rebaudengoi]|nr:hypothetical protein C8J57DRAFT_1625189 [Mycena rebaudengoi]